MRVVSLLPSATELLCAIGGRDLLVGRSHECDFPASVAALPALTAARTKGGTSGEIDRQVRETLGAGGGQSLYTLNESLLAELAPDVILTQDTCDVCSVDLATVRSCAARLKRTPQVISLDPRDIFGMFDDLLRVGEAVGLKRQAQETMVRLRGEYWSAVDHVNPYVPAASVLVLEWTDPLFVAGHWTPGLVEAAGGRHPLNAAGARSRVVTPEEVIESMPERIMICPCGVPLYRIGAELRQLEATRWWGLLPAVAEAPAATGLLDSRVALVDGTQMFSRPGPRLVEAFRFLVAWLQGRPELLPDAFPAMSAPLPN